MKWLFFFLVLSFFATAALAAPGNSPSVPKEEGSPTVPKDDSLTVSKNDPSTFKDVLPDLPLTLVYSKLPRREQLRMQLTCKQFKDLFQSKLLDSVNTEAEFKFLDQYRGLNQAPQFDEVIISKFVQEHAFKDFKEADIRHAVEVARKARHAVEGPKEPRTGFYVTRRSERKNFFLDTLDSELEEKRRGDYDDLYYTESIDAVVRTTVNSLPVKPWDPVWDCNVYNDDNNMDDLLCKLMLMEETRVDAHQFWEILKGAREEIKEERSQLEHPYAQNLEVDAQMIQKIVARLPATANEDHIQRIMKQARHANSLTGAVIFNLQHALRKLVASDINIPVSIFKKILFKANQVEILKILRLHPHFHADFFHALIKEITDLRKDKWFPLFKLLLKDELATPAIIYEAVKDIIRRTGKDHRFGLFYKWVAEERMAEWAWEWAEKRLAEHQTQ